MKQKNILTIIITLLIILLLSLAVLIRFYVFNDTSFSNSLGLVWVNIIVGAISSLLASFVFLQIQKAGDNEQNEVITEIIRKTVESSVEKHIEMTRLISEAHQKDYYEPHFWVELINGTSSRLDLAGHTLHKWMEEHYRGCFENKIYEMLKADKEIRILFSKEDLDLNKIKRALAEKSERGLSKKEKTIYGLISIIIRRDLRDKAQSLHICISDSEINYMYLRTDKKCVISPYFIYKDSTMDRSLLIEVKIDSAYAEALANDFNDSICESSQMEIEEYLK